jgi:hypothetical protein
VEGHNISAFQFEMMSCNGGEMGFWYGILILEEYHMAHFIAIKIFVSL